MKDGGRNGDGLATTQQPVGGELLWPPGALLDGDYRVERLLGEGGMGIVLAARDVRGGELVAIKLIRPERAGDPALVKRFLREARITLQLKSPRTVRVLRLGQLASGLPYLVMEYLEGGTVASLLRERGALPVATAVDYLLQACEAVAEAHLLGIVHRDLKPTNLFLARGPDGSVGVKVIDFGISKWIGGQSQADDGQLTTTAGPLGSPRYMSPEQLGASRVVDGRTDIWALGVILHELVTGTHPFVGESAADLCARILRDPAPALGAELAGAAALDPIYQRCLAKDPALRFPSVGDLAAALARHGSEASRASLARIAAMLPAGATTVPFPAGDDGGARRRWPWMVAALVAAVGLAAGAYAIRARAVAPPPGPAAPPPAIVEPAPSGIAPPPAAPAPAPLPVAAPAMPAAPAAQAPRPAEQRGKHRHGTHETRAPAAAAPAPGEDLFNTRR
jgi:serine/threonine-protein kinase